MFNMAGKRIIITGASRGLGEVCAKSFSEQGARLVLMARTEEKLEEIRAGCTSPDEHLAVTVDITNFQKLGEAVSKAASFLKSIDAVLHVAGGGLGLRDVLLDANGLQRLFALNVVAAAEINRLVVPSMKQRGKGNLVHVSSVAGREAVASVGYNTVKAALAAYVRSVGNELAADGIIATGILPGGFRAPGNSWERLKAEKPEVVEKFIKDRLPRNRLAEADELTPLLAFLCSDQASMMSGCMVPIDAGEGKGYTPCT